MRGRRSRSSWQRTTRTSVTAADPGRVVAVDVGTKKVGLAMSDPLRLFAQPVGTFGDREALDKLKDLAQADGIALAVVGWPLTEDGREGKATRMVNIYIRRMRKAVPGLKVLRQDERYTSEEARARLSEAGSRGKVDTMAAGIILQEYLDSQPQPAPGNVSLD
ncbi:MAG: Holliday junction resolvase RuvX [Rhodothermales bacterium]|nr:Holliday junction resolvase RuvX [Rhodothermales bacterium]